MDARSPSTDRDRIDAARRRASRLLGVRAGALDRKTILEREVALAKGRSALKSEIDEFLEQLQAAAHRRNTGSFEKLLTLLVQEVLPGSPPIGLELSTERGLPSLDIFSRKAADIRQDIFADQGGAITNIVCAGLRLIATVKSGGRRFLVLDEADCWVKPDRVADFYRIFRQAAERVGIQCLVISHHSHTLFGEGMAIAELQGSPTDGAHIVSHTPDVSSLWTPEAHGFRSLRLIDFQNHPNSELSLSPGITVLIGPNDLGKSSIVRALAAMFYGDTRDSLIRHGAKGCSVEIEMSDSRRLCFTRKLRRNPVNMWSLHEADGTVVVENGVRLETGGRAVPDWIPAVTGIAPIDDLEIHIANQKKPVFLLSEPPAKRAAVLSIGQESSHLREMITIQRERTMRDQTIIREGERELTELTTRISALENIESIEAAADECARLLDVASEAAAEAQRAQDCLDRIEQTFASTTACRERLSLLEQLPAESTLRELAEASRDTLLRIAFVDDLAAATERASRLRSRAEILTDLPDMPLITQTDQCDGLALAITSSQENVSSLSARKSMLASLPHEAPTILDTERVIDSGRAIGNLVGQIPAIRGQLAGIDDELKSVLAETDALLAEMGHACPTCGQAVSDAAQLLREIH